MQGEYDLQRDMQFATQRLQNGQMTYRQYEELYNQRREARDIEQTRGTLRYLNDQRNSSVTAAARRETAAGNEEAANAMWDYKAAQAAYDVEMERRLQDPNLSAEQIGDLGKQWQEDSLRLTQQFGVDVRDTPLNTQVRTVVEAVTEANKRRETAEMEGTLIDHAMRNGTVADLPPKLRAKAFEAMDKQAMATTQQLVDTGQIPAEAADQEIAAQSFQNWIRAGTVDDTSQAQFSAAITNRLTTPDGEANPGAVNAMLAYAGMIDSGHHAVAETVFKNGQARNRAQMILAAAGGPTATPEDISHALISAQTSIERAGNTSVMQTGGNIGNIAEASNMVAKEVSTYLGRENIGWFQSIFDRSIPGEHGIGDTFLRTGSNEAVLFTQENEDMLRDHIVAEVERRHALDPNLGIPVSNLVEIVTQDVLSRTSVVADQIVTMEPGFSIAEQMFGEDLKSYANVPGLEDRVIKAYVAHQAEQNPDEWGMLVGSSFGEKFFQLPVDAFAGIFGTETYSITGEDARQIGMSETGVRPLGMYRTNGEVAEFYVVGQNGVPITIPWSLQEMGTWYHQREKARAEARADNRM